MTRGTRTLVREQLLDAAPERVFAFFADPSNLERITPLWLRFRIVTPGPVELRKGSQIDYRLELAGIPIRWRTRILAWEPGVRFVDAQEKGPFALWEHEHRFQILGGRVHVLDRVAYRLPLGILGRAVAGLPVRAALDAIFDHRYQTIARDFSTPPQPIA